MDEWFFFFYWRYNPLWVLAFSVILLHSVLSLLSFLHPLIPNAWMSFSVSSTHLFLGLPLILLPFGFHSNTLLGILFSSIHITCPNQAILLLFMNLTMYAFPMSPFNSWFILILQDPSLSCTGPKIFINILRMGEWLIFLIWMVLGSNHGSKASCSVWYSSFPQSLQAKRKVPVIRLLLPHLVSSPVTHWLSCHLMLQKWDVDSFMKTRFQKMCVVYTEHVHWAALITCDMLRYFTVYSDKQACVYMKLYFT